MINQVLSFLRISASLSLVVINFSSLILYLVEKWRLDEENDTIDKYDKYELNQKFLYLINMVRYTTERCIKICQRIETDLR